MTFEHEEMFMPGLLVINMYRHLNIWADSILHSYRRQYSH